MKVNLTFDLAEDADFRLWSRIAAVLGNKPEETPPAATPTRPKIAPAPAAQTAPVEQPQAAPAAANVAPVAQAAPAAAAPGPAATGNGAGVPSVQDLREALAQLGAASSAGAAADFLRLKIGSPNLSSIPEDKRSWALQMLKQETASQAAMA
jgi:hypothetical protein